MLFVQDDDMVNTFASYRSDQPLDNAVLPRTAWCDRLVPDAHGSQSACDGAATYPIPIADEVAGSLLPRKCFRYLTCNPFCRRSCCDVDPEELSAAQPDDDERIAQVETDRWNHKQVHGCDVWHVIMQEGPPSLAGRPSPLDHVLGNARLRDLKPKFEQFAMNTRCSPKRILCAHLPDQRAQLRFDLRPPSQWARLPTPVAAKAGRCQRTRVSGWMIARTCRIDGTSGTAGSRTSDPGWSAGRDHATRAARPSADVEAPRSPPRAATST
jgi:hypothetical protein